MWVRERILAPAGSVPLRNSYLCIAGIHYVGTADSSPVNFRVNNMQALRLQFGANGSITGVNVVGGAGSNSIHNTAGGESSTVAGGQNNATDRFCDFVAGGYQNRAAGPYAFAAGQRAKALHLGTFVWSDFSDSDFSRTGNNQFLIRSTGGVGINTNDPAGFALNVAGEISCTSLTQTSDARLKKNVASLDHAVEIIRKLRGVSFDWDRETRKHERFPGGKQIGFIVQEVEQVLPELVTTDRNGYKSVAMRTWFPFWLKH
jgi:hypothetical protein